MNAQTRWTSISWHAALILNRLRNQQQLSTEQEKEPGGTDPETGDKPEQHPDERTRYVEEGLRRIARFEDRARGLTKHRPKLRRP